MCSTSMCFGDSFPFVDDFDSSVALIILVLLPVCLKNKADECSELLIDVLLSFDAVDSYCF